MGAMAERIPPDRWYATNGVVAVGPLAFTMLSQGLAQGRIPEGSFVRHESWKMWRPVEDVGGLTDRDRQRIVAHLAGISSALESRASDPSNHPPPPPTEAELGFAARDAEPLSRPSFRPAAVDPVGVLASAPDLDAALGLALTTSVQAASAGIGLLHQYRPDLGGAVTSFTHGPHTESLLGERLDAGDPTVAMARDGHTVLVEPRVGTTGRFIAGRLRRCLPQACAFAMVPLVLFGELVAFVEVARTSHLFKAREVARIEDVLEALAERIVVAGWL